MIEILFVLGSSENSNKGYTFKEDRGELFPILVSETTHSNGTIKQNLGY